MNYHEYFADFSLRLWTELAAHLWQSTLFLLLIFLFVALLGKASAKSRYAVWLAASVKFALPLSAFAALGSWLNLGSLIPRSADANSLSSNGVDFSDIILAEPVAAVISTADTPNNHNEIFCVLTLLWLVACLSLFALWWKRSRSFKALLGYRNTPTSEREAELLNNAQHRVGLTARVHLFISDSIIEPVVLGIWKPVIVMPRGLSQKLTDDEFESVLIHELSHVARRDNLVGVLQMALCCLLWFHPLIWLIKRKLLEEREQACDEAVVRRESKPEVYVSGLLKVVRYGLHSQQSAGLANAAGTNLSQRVELIMKNKTTKIKGQKWIVGVAFGALCLLCVAAGFTAAARTGGADNSSTADSPATEEFYKVEIHADGKLYSTMGLRAPKPGGAVFQYGLFRVPEDRTAQTVDGQRIYAFQLIPTPEKDSVKIEIAALLEDLNTVSNSRPLHEFKKQTVAARTVRTGESAVVSEMSQLGVQSFELRVVKVAATQNESQESDIPVRTMTIRKSDELPDVSLKIVGNDDSPVKITEATSQQITNALYTKLTGQTTVTTGADGKTVFSNVFSAPIVRLVNDSGKTVTQLSVAVVNPRPTGNGQMRFVFEGNERFPVSIAPGKTYTISFRGDHPTSSEKYWLPGFTDPQNFYAKVSSVRFDDDTSWTAK